VTTVSAMIDIPQLSPTLSWKELEDAVGDVDQRLKDVGVDDHECTSP